MHANRFEKEVQGKLEGMQLQPSAPVWAAVEERIRRERRKRRLLFFWLFPLLLLGGLGAYLLSNGEKGNSNATATATPTKRMKANDRRNTVSNAPADQPMSTNPGSAGKETSDQRATDKASSGKEPTFMMPGYVDVNIPALLKSNTQRIKRARAKAQAAGTHTKPDASTLSPGTTTARKAATGDLERADPAPVASSNNTPSNLPATAPAVSDSLTKKTAVTGPLPDTMSKATATELPQPKPHKRRLQWAIEAGGGIAAPVGGGETPLRASSMSAVNASSNSGNSTEAWAAGPSFHVGVLLSLPLKGRLRLQTGLGFERIRLRRESTTFNYANSGATGNPFGGTAGNGSIKTTTAHTLGYLRLPLLLEWRPAARSSLAINSGITLNQLLIKPADNGVRSTTFDFQLGARFRVAKLGRHSLELGPQFSAGLTRFESRQRLLRAGAVLRFSF
ncbi:MAG: hypothetical protein EOO15_03300 [Chitinophagaceae bacterium]|nr:MAG: hypothetical protein EOO15_03300 [Chitinophagaceae bacterium]